MVTSDPAPVWAQLYSGGDSVWITVVALAVLVGGMWFLFSRM